MSQGLQRAGGRLARCRRVLALFASLVVAAPTPPAVAQVDTGTILGTVKDSTGGVMPGATVTIRHEGQGFTLTGVTREDGTFIFTPIRTGIYTIEVEMQGFRKSERRGRSEER